MSPGNHSGASKHSVSNVPKIFRSLSQALRISSPSPNISHLITYQDGKFNILDDDVKDILINGTYQEKLVCINILKHEIVNFVPSKRLEVWNLIQGEVDLKVTDGIRSSTLELMARIIKLDSIPLEDLVKFYCTIVENIDLENSDRDLEWFLTCLDGLLKCDNAIDIFESYRDHPLAVFLFQLYKRVSALKQEEFHIMTIEMISTSMKVHPNMFSNDELTYLVNTMLDGAVNTNNELMLKAFIRFTGVLILTTFDFSDRLYTIISIIGCAYGLDYYELEDSCDSIFYKLLKTSKSPEKFLSVLLKVIGGVDQNKYKHKEGDRSKIGCIRYLAQTFTYLGKQNDIGKAITGYYNYNLGFILEILIVVAKKYNHYVKIEILKLIAELFETQYTIKGYYKMILDKVLFWQLLEALNWDQGTVMTYSYQEVLLELFNKLQTLDISKFVQNQLIKYLASNYSILTSYNIEYLLNYYAENELCVCGMANWKGNCKEIVEKYYCTASSQVFKVIKNSFISCLQLKIDTPSLKFYIDLLCYTCVLNLSFPLTDCDILLPLTDILITLDDLESFESIVDNYIRGIFTEGETNSLVLMKILISYTVKAPCSHLNLSNRVNLVINRITDITLKACESKTQDLIFHYGISLLSSLRVRGGLLYIKHIDYNEDEIFIKLLTPYFKRVPFKNSIDIEKLLNLYKHVIMESHEWKYYYNTLKGFKLQVLNEGVFEPYKEEIQFILEILIEQLQLVYDFKFILPKNINKKDIQLLIIDTLYGFMCFQTEASAHRLAGLVKYLVLDMKFDDYNRNPLMQFLNTCIYETSGAIKDYLSSMIYIINDSINDHKYRILILETIMSIYYNRGKYSIKEDDYECIFNILLEFMNLDHDKKDCDLHLRKTHYLLFIISYELCNWYLPTIPPTDNSLTNYVTGKLSDVLFNGLSERFQIANIRVDLLDVETHDENFNHFYNEIIKDIPQRPLHKLINWGFVKQELNINDIINYSATFKLIWTNEVHNVELQGWCIWVNKLEDNENYYCVNTFGFKGLVIKDLIISSENVANLVTTLVFICGMHIFMDLES